MTVPYSRPGSTSPGLWLGLAIASTLLCCLPLGLVGVIYAALALGAQGRGDWADAEDKARKAKGWTIAAAVVSLVALVIWFCGGGLISS